MKPKLAFFHSQITESPALTDARDRLANLTDVSYHPFLVGSPARLAEHAADSEIIVANDVALTASDLSLFPKLRLFSLLGSGYDMVSLTDTQAAGVTVCNAPTYGTENVAQHTLALILELSHRVGKQDEALKTGGWKASRKQCIEQFPVVELHAMTLGVVGFGNIAKRIASMVSGLGMQVIASSSQPAEELNAHGVRKVSLDELFATADVVSLHCRSSDETRNMVDARLLTLMKHSAYLVNTARGDLIDEQALCQALDHHDIAGAAVDVVATEPPSESHPLVGHPRCVVTPHIAWNSQPAKERLVHATIDNIDAFLNGVPINQVN